MTSQARRIPDSMLECYLADSLDALTRAQLEETLASSPMDRTRLEELRAESAAFLIQHPSAPLMERFRRERKQRRWWHWPVLLAPVAAAAVVIAMLWPPKPIEPDTLPKGPPILIVHRKTNQGSEEVPSGWPLVPGDSVRFTVRAGKNGFLAVLGRDTQGVVTLYHPYGGKAAAPYDVTQQELPEAFVLDRTLGKEDLYTLFSPGPFELGWAIQALEQGRDLASVAPKDVVVGRTFLTKAKSRY